jgi:hypothetical protein
VPSLFLRLISFIGLSLDVSQAEAKEMAKKPKEKFHMFSERKNCFKEKNFQKEKEFFL